MSHVVVGERLAGAAPELIGHVIRGAGHFIEATGGLFQSGALHMPAIPLIAGNAINDLSTPIGAERWQWERMQGQYGYGSLIAGSGNESYAADRALRDGIERHLEMLIDSAQNAGMSILSAAAGDPQSALDYGAKAAEKYVNVLLEDWGLGRWSTEPALQGTLQTPGAGR
jgi:hypothetical protein